MKYEELLDRTIKWADLHKIDNLQSQALKCVEEWGETVEELNHGRFGEEFEDGIGDSIISFTIFAHIAGKDMLKCWEDSLNVIEKRAGNTINGNFIKSE